MHGADELAASSGYELVKFFFLLTFAAAIPAIVSGGIAERARFAPVAGNLPDRWPGLSVLRRHRLERQPGIPGMAGGDFGVPFHDFAGSVVVHAVGGWIACPRCCCWGAAGAIKGWWHRRASALEHSLPRARRLDPHRGLVRLQRDESAQRMEAINGLVALNSLMAMVAVPWRFFAAGRKRPGFVHNGPLAAGGRAPVPT